MINQINFDRLLNWIRLVVTFPANCAIKLKYVHTVISWLEYTCVDVSKYKAYFETYVRVLAKIECVINRLLSFSKYLVVLFGDCHISLNWTSSPLRYVFPLECKQFDLAISGESLVAQNPEKKIHYKIENIDRLKSVSISGRQRILKENSINHFSRKFSDWRYFHKLFELFRQYYTGLNRGLFQETDLTLKHLVRIP